VSHLLKSAAGFLPKEDIFMLFKVLRDNLKSQKRGDEHKRGLKAILQ